MLNPLLNAVSLKKKVIKDLKWQSIQSKLRVVHVSEEILAELDKHSGFSSIVRVVHDEFDLAIVVGTLFSKDVAGLQVGIGFLRRIPSWLVVHLTLRQGHFENHLPFNLQRLEGVVQVVGLDR